MPDWTKSMQQTFEYYKVDPYTWSDKERLKCVKTCSIIRDSGMETLGSATFDVTEEIGECYIRAYLITIQNGITEKHPLGTFLAQSPSTTFDGKIKSISMDSYTPLIELKEKCTPLGYSIFKNSNIMEQAYLITRENVRAPVVKAYSDIKLYFDFVANTNDTWLSFNTDLISNAKYEYSLDEMGRILFSPKQDIASLQPVWTYTDNNSSILYPDISLDHDLYGIPNVVEVVYSNGKDFYNHRIVNDDPNSITSTYSRGREIIYRDTNPSLVGNSTNKEVKEYAKILLKSLSSIEYTVSYTHGYCPVRLGDCIRLDYIRAGFRNIKAKVISQNIKCSTSCQVTEKAVFMNKLWEG